MAVRLEVTREIDLDPADLFRARFRPHRQLQRGEARPFDREACLH